MLFSVLKKLNFDGTLEIIDSNDKIYKFGNSNPHVCIRLKNKSIERKLFFNPNLHIDLIGKSIKDKCIFMFIINNIHCTIWYLCHIRFTTTILCFTKFTITTF